MTKSKPEAYLCGYSTVPTGQLKNYTFTSLTNVANRKELSAVCSIVIL